MMALYRRMTVEQLEIEYSPSSMIGGNYKPFLEHYIEESKRVLRIKKVSKELAYGDRPSQVVDLFHAANGMRPLHLFIHGGYWQELSHRESATMVQALVAKDINVAVMNYTLAPEASIEQMVEECYQCLSYLVEDADNIDIDHRNVSISGHSAGAQLLMQMLHQYQHNGEGVLSGIKLAVPISGIFDLTPLCHTSVNDPLKLDTGRAINLSPMFHEVMVEQKILVAVGQYDTNEFRRQSRDYHQRLIEKGTKTSFIEVKGVNHFDIISTFETAAIKITDAIIDAHRTLR